MYHLQNWSNNLQIFAQECAGTRERSWTTHSYRNSLVCRHDDCTEKYPWVNQVLSGLRLQMRYMIAMYGWI